jgi:hypothetical protein
LIFLGGVTGHFNLIDPDPPQQVPVLISDLDMECKLWIKLRLAPICPWLGTISLAFVGAPNVKVQLSPYNRVRLMRVPVVQTFLRKLFTEDLPGFMVRDKDSRTCRNGTCRLMNRTKVDQLDKRGDFRVWGGEI